LPPDRETLEKRLLERGTEKENDVEQRLEDSSIELPEASWYDYSIVNDVLEEAVEALAAIILANAASSRKVSHES
jgi:guanylate kinase